MILHKSETLFLHKNIVSPVEAKYSYFSVDFRSTIF